MRHLLIEEAHPIITDYLKDFCAFACGKLGIATCPPITFVEHTGNASFGSYSPSEGTVIVATHGRHAADILRTLAHELVHDQQMTMGAQDPLEILEYEANAIAGMLLREYNQAHPTLYGLLDNVATQQDDTDEEHESFGQGVPTNPPYPTTYAEEAPVNAAGSGQIAGIGIGPQGEPGVHPRKKTPLFKRTKNLGFLGLPTKTLKQFMRGE